MEYRIDRYLNAFPPKLLQDFLIDRSNDPYFDPTGTTIWHDMLRLFAAMNDGRAFGGPVALRTEKDSSASVDYEEAGVETRQRDADQGN